MCQFEEETLQSLEDTAEAVKSATSSLTARDPVAAAAQRIVDEANKSVSGDNTLEGWKAKAEKAVSCLCHWAVLVFHWRLEDAKIMFFGRQEFGGTLEVRPP